MLGVLSCIWVGSAWAPNEPSAFVRSPWACQESEEDAIVGEFFIYGLRTYSRRTYPDYEGLSGSIRRFWGPIRDLIVPISLGRFRLGGLLILI